MTSRLARAFAEAVRTVPSRLPMGVRAAVAFAAAMLGAASAPQTEPVPPDTARLPLSEVVVDALRTPLPMRGVPYAVAVAEVPPGQPALSLQRPTEP